MSLRNVLLPCCLCVLLPGCGGASEETVPPTEVGLEGPIASDPDLALTDTGDAVLGLGGGSSAGMPRIDSSPETLVRIREEAVRIVGGNQAMLDAPAPEKSEEGGEEILTLQQRFASSRLASAACAGNIDYGGRYSATMPQPFVPYPEAALQEAAGADGKACKLRGAVFRTPVDVQEVLNFYYTLADSAGFEQARSELGEYQVLSGRRTKRAFALYVRPLGDGIAEAELLVASD